MTPGLLTKVRVFFLTPAPHRSAKEKSRRRAARQALVCGLATFLTATLGLSASVETVMPEWRDPQFGHRLTLLQRGNTPDRPLVVAIGTSRTQNGLSPSAMGFAAAAGSPRVFNFGQTASPPIKQLLTLHRVLDAGIKPDVVIVEMFAPNLGSGGPAESDLPNVAPRLSLAEIDHLAPYSKNPSVFRTAWIRARANPWSTQRQILMNHWLPQWQPWSARFEFQWTSLDADGFQPVKEAGAERRARAIAHAQKEYAGLFARFTVGKPSVRAIRDLVAVCRREGIRVAFFIPPISPAFRASFAPGVYSEGEAYVCALGRELGVPVFPAPVDMNEDEFLDGHHLYRRGAERYSRWLADNHLKPWLTSVGIGGAP